jgi:RND family efflux transporter MFP subunit
VAGTETRPTTTLAQLKIDRTAAVPRRRRHRIVWWIAGVAIVAIAAAWLLAPRAAEVEVTSVLTSTPSQQYAVLTASGYVVAQRRAAVASKATGRLLELNVREGSRVKKGEVIARLDASDVQASILAASAGVRQAEAGVRQAEAVLRQAQVELANADAELKRTQDLRAQDFVSPQAEDAAQRRADAARAAVAAAQSGVAQARASVAQAQAQLKVQQVNEDFTQIRAPFDGVVLVKNANVGDIITPFSSAAGTQGAVVTMADMSTLEVEADVAEGNLGQARIGQPVAIELDALPGTRFRGQVVGIVPTVDRAKATVMTKIRFDKLDPRILPEMSARVTFLSQPITDEDLQPVLAVNPAAIVERAQRKAVLRLKKDGQADVLEAVPVTPGRKLGDLVEITGALKSGDRLVLAPRAGLDSGAKVEVVAR